MLDSGVQRPKIRKKHLVQIICLAVWGRFWAGLGEVLGKFWGRFGVRFAGVLGEVFGRFLEDKNLIKAYKNL